MTSDTGGENEKIIDLSVAVESGLPCDPPNQIPHIKYCNHKDTAAEMAGFFGNATVDDLPEEMAGLLNL